MPQSSLLLLQRIPRRESVRNRAFWPLFWLPLPPWFGLNFKNAPSMAFYYDKVHTQLDGIVLFPFPPSKANGVFYVFSPLPTCMDLMSM